MPDPEVMIGVTPPSDWRYIPPSPQIVSIGQPAAGSDWTLTRQSKGLFRVGSIFAKLTTSATAATRVPRAQVVDGTTRVLVSVVVPAVIAATKAVEITWAREMGRGDATGINHVVSLPDVTFPPNSQLKMSTTGLAAGDQWSDVVVIVEYV